MKKTIFIVGETQREQAHKIIDLLPLDELHQVAIFPVVRDPKREQYNLMWKWEGIIASELGDTKEDQHEWSKLNFLLPIFYRDDPQFAATLDAIDECKARGMAEQAKNMKRVVVSLTSTLRCNKKQLTEFMDCLERHAKSLNIRLPTNEY